MKHYDKIFFAIAVIAAGASCAFYFMNAPKGELLRGRVESLEQKQPSGIAWKNIVVPALQVASIEWPEVRAGRGRQMVLPGVHASADMG